MPTDTPSPHSGPTWSALFKDDLDAFCEPAALAAADSPAAYLQALYRFALEVENSGKGTRDKITLQQRRPTLRNLVVDAENTTRQLPLLTLINETLHAAVEEYLNKNRQLYGDRTAHQVLAYLRYPFELPFDLAHRQCVLGLAGNKPGLGELNYRISLKLPCSAQAESKYGTVHQDVHVAQSLLTLLSPAQQDLLTDKSDWKVTGTELEDLYKKHYGDSQPITEQQLFRRHTGLSTQQLHELLAQGSYRPRLSKNVSQSAAQRERDRTVGARFVNVAENSGPMPLELNRESSGQYHLQNTSAQRHDRLQRMIRLQRWLDMPFADLDTLLYSIMGCEGRPTTEPITLNDNSLRALGVFRYLNRRYGLKPQGFSAWLYQMPVHGSGQAPALFDQVFNPAHSCSPALALDNQPLDLKITELTLYRVCGALGLEDTPQSLGLLKTRTQQHFTSPRRDAKTFSSFYRQATLPALFGLSVMDCDHLCQLLGGKVYRQQLVKPRLRKSGRNEPMDFLDVLMHLDWAVTWLKESGISVQQLRQQLLPNDLPLSAPLQQRIGQLDKVLHRLPRYLLNQAAIDGLHLPQPDEPLAYAWNVLLAKGLLKAAPLLPEQPNTEHLAKSVESMVDEKVTMSQDIERDKALKNRVKEKLNTLLSAAYSQLRPFRQEIEQLFKESSLASEAAHMLDQALAQASRVFANALGSKMPRDNLKHLLLLFPGIEAELQVPLSREALLVLLLNPHWLDSEHTAGSTLKLTLGTLYLLQRFNQFSQRYGVSHAVLLNYLELANHPPPDSGPSPIHKQLARMMSWIPEEIEQLIAHLPKNDVRSMAELDWLMRCHDTARQTGLSASMLLMTTGLTASSSSSDWQKVASAVLATHP